MSTKAPTKPSTPRLSEIAREVVVPKGAVSTGWPAVEKKCGELGISFRPWQPDVGRIILAKRDNGKYAATIGGTGLSIPRQVGKTFLVGAIVFALCLLRPNLTVIWTAHRLRTAEETFGKMLAFAKRKRIKPHILKTPLGSGEEAVIFRNGSRILFGARERGFGRGFDEVDVLIFDEGQILTEAALDDMIPATNQSRQETSALLLFMGTPPKPSDPGEVFTRMRDEALSGEDDDTGWIEFGADEDYEPTPLPAPLTEADWIQIAKANPSFPEDTPREAILRMRKKLGADSFLREGAGVWNKSRSGAYPAWSRRGTKAEPGLPACLAVSANVDQLWLSLGAASVDETPHLGLVRRDSALDEGLFVAEVKRIQDEHQIPVVIDAKGPASFLIKSLIDAGVKVHPAGLEDWIQACAEMKTAAYKHGDYPDLQAAAAASGWRKVGDRRVLARRAGEIDALEAVVWARWGIENAKYVNREFWGAFG